MTAAARKFAPRPTALEIFIARAEARARLWQAGEFDLHDAVDELQAAAVRDRLVAELGQDRVQALMVEAFAPVRDASRDGSKGEPERLTKAERRVIEKIPASTLMAAEYLVQQGDAEGLRNLLDRHSADERTAIRKHLEAKRCH